MNFMASRREGFLEDGSSKGIVKDHPFSQCSSSSSSFSSKEKPFIVPFRYNHNHQKPYWWFNNKSPDQEEPIIIDSSSASNNKLIIPLVNGENEGDHRRHLHQFIITHNPIEGECSETVIVQKEHMFDKVLTPSDVGKLNRLVIPKQHAEKYFPLDSSNNGKGLLLNFEDENGKQWRFRYSYWNSSQSYVMTKGWSRFVKEKKLDAGDVVSFQRGLAEISKERFYIDWRRRPHPPPLYRHDFAPPVLPFSHRRPYHNNSLYFPPQTMEQNKVHFLQSHNTVYGPSSFIYLKSTAFGGGRGGGGGGGDNKQPRPTEVFESVPVVQGKVSAKRLRLFGVNMECPILESSIGNECELIESSVVSQHQPFSHVNKKGKASISLDLNKFD